jgi:hypothetical protein
MSPDNKAALVGRRYPITDIASDTSVAPSFPSQSPAQIARRNPDSDDISFRIKLDTGDGFTVTGTAENYARVFRHIAPDTVFQAPAAPKAERSRPATVHSTRCLSCDKKFRIEGSTYYST